MKDFENSQRQESRDWDASDMPEMKPPEFGLTADGMHHFGDKGESKWKTTSNLLIQPGERRKPFNFSLENGKPFFIDASKGQELGTSKGGIVLSTVNEISAHLAENSVLGMTNIDDAFNYTLGSDSRYHLSPNGAGPQEKALGGPYTLRSELLSAGPESIHRRISLFQAKGQEVNEDSKTTTGKSGNKGGINASASGGAHQKTQINVELDGNDVLLIAGGKTKRMPKEEALSNKELESALGGFDELLAKQKASGELGMQGAGDLASYFGYYYENTSESKSVRSSTQNYETGGLIHTDDQIIEIHQNPKPAATALFEEEGQTEASGTTEERVTAFLQSNQEMMTQVKNGFYRIKLSGYASATGTKDANQELSLKRADEIRDLIVKNDMGVNPFKHFTTEGNGSKFARIGSANDADRAVVIEFVKVQ